MNTKLKRRLAVVTGVIIMVVILLLAVVGGGTAAKTVTVAQAIDYQPDAKIQVTGTVVDNSFEIADDVLTFEIFDATADPAGTARLTVRYDGGVSATFGNEVTAICTGKKNAEGILVCSELVTKCPSKYESATGALSIADLYGYGDNVLDKPVKVAGLVQAGTLAGVDAPVRFTLEDTQDASVTLPIAFTGALSDDIADGSSLVITGSINAQGVFTATDVSLEG